jgi:predicted RNA-binding Zn ribbon-like protein
MMTEMKRDISNTGLIAGRLCLDFTNTLDWRGTDNPFELLNNYEDLVTWSGRLGLLSDQETCHVLEIAGQKMTQSGSVYKRALALREALYRIFANIAQTQKPNQDDLVIFNQELSAAMARSRVSATASGFKWQWADQENPLDQVLWPIVFDAATLLTSDMLSRVGMCADKKCAWLFLDTSKNHKRRWCSMEDCGNRAKFQRHYKRKLKQGMNTKK